MAHHQRYRNLSNATHTSDTTHTRTTTHTKGAFLLRILESVMGAFLAHGHRDTVAAAAAAAAAAATTTYTLDTRNIERAMLRISLSPSLPGRHQEIENGRYRMGVPFSIS